MSNLKILKKIYNSNRFIKIIIFIQIICSLMMTITFYIRSLISDDLSIIVVTHDPNVAQFTDKVFKMIDGKFMNE